MATKRQRNYTQMALPFDLADLRKPARSVLPPGLREFAAADKLTDEQVKRLDEAYGTIRGGKPMTVEEWREIWLAVSKFA